MAEMALLIRRYVEADHARVLELHILGLKQFEANSPRGSWDADVDDIEGRYFNSKGEFLVGELDGQVVAMGGFWRKTDEMAEIKRMRVDPEYQGRGFGQAILTELEIRARSLGYTSLFLDTLPTMTPARHLYTKNGFVQTGTKKVGRFEAILYEKTLSTGSHKSRLHPGPPVPSLKFATIEQTVFFKASPEVVYDALLDPRKHSEFTGSPATTSKRKGAAFTAWEGYITGKNIELVKAKKIVQEWKTTEWPDGYPVSRLKLTLTAKKGGTELKMVHSKVPAQQAASYTSGWKSSYWDPLKAYLADSKPKKTGNKGSKKK